MERVWTGAIPAGVPVEHDVSHYEANCESLATLLEQSLRAHANACAFVCMGRELSYAELDARSRHLAGWFQMQGLERGARIAVMLPNLLQFPIALVAIVRAGYVAVNVDPHCAALELEHRLADSGAQAIVLLDTSLATLRAVRASTAIRHAVVTSASEMVGARGPALAGENGGMACIGFFAAAAEGAEAGFSPVRLTAGDTAVLQYGCAASGAWKSVTLLHRHLIANLLQWQACCEPAHPWRTEIDQPATVVALPHQNLFGLTMCCLLTMRRGGLGILMPDPSDVPGMIRALRGYRVQAFAGIETIYEALSSEPEFAALDFTQLVPVPASRLALHGCGLESHAGAPEPIDPARLGTWRGEGLEPALQPCVFRMLPSTINRL
ncbi:AMP-binding protein [Paraburkholderia sp. J63]|uniref:AMP-binding protein n=1 Tax=Paraburkholderia sp. J63 TaxID=2805434 RepID=UPI002ABE15B8|nr:AMP-binding protein [Paraburkholderia sp. J63]